MANQPPHHENNNPKPSIVAQLDPKLVRQVLLTDPSKFHTLHASNAPQRTPSFEEFQRDHIDSTTSMEATMKRAFRDHLVAQNDDEDLKPLVDLVLQLHNELRSLVPNRQDLHTLVSDEAVSTAETVDDLLPLLLHASQGLESLESEARAETTVQWRQQAQAKHKATTAEFIVTSTLYLLYKTELCQADKKDFYLQRVWAPRIHIEGPQYLRDLMETGSEGHVLTTNWINELVANYERLQELKESEKARHDLIRKGWVRTILFRKDQATPLPEILALDVDNMRLIRRGCARAVAGCALALHAAAPASGVLSERIDPTSPIGLRRADLVQAMASSNHSASSYDEKVSLAVVALAETWAASSSTPDVSSLRNRTVAVLRGEDPVIQLLDRRMQEVFADVLISDVSNAPLVMRSGVQHNSTTTNDEMFERQSEDAFCRKGLSFYAPELATLSLFAKKSIDLAWQVHQALIEKILLEAISHA